MLRLLNILLASLMVAIPLWDGLANAANGPVPGVNYNIPNFANSPLPTVTEGTTVQSGSTTVSAGVGKTISGGMRKFVDRLALPWNGTANNNLVCISGGLTGSTCVGGLNTGGGPNNLGQYIPVATPDTFRYPGSDYYEIEVGEYYEQMHSDLPKTKLRGYRQTNTFDPIVSKFHYLGPLIMAQKGRPVRIKFTNRLPVGAAGDLFLPVDTTLMGAGLGPDGVNSYTQNRATLHLHGGTNPWISDGTPHQWTAPAGENTPYKKGVNARNVPDMGLPQDGSITFYWPNQEGGRLLFYHDHAYGITRLNVYGGEAAGYLLTDPFERNLTPNMADIPLVIQDKTFVPDEAQLRATDPLWDSYKWGGKGSLWLPHVYMPNQDPDLPNGCCNPMGRWDYGPWFWPVTPAVAPMPLVSTTPEVLMDTPVVNGTAYPYIEVDPKEYRFRILNAAGDRHLNLQLHQATSIIKDITITHGGKGYTAEPSVIITDPTGRGATARATADLNPGSSTYGQVTNIDVLTVGSGYTAPVVEIRSVAIADAVNNGVPGAAALATASVHLEPTEIGMVPAKDPGPDPSLMTAIKFPPDWGTRDNRYGGYPDPAWAGPAWIVIGNEGGILRRPALKNNIPVGYDYDRKNPAVLNVKEHTLLLSPAERSDAVVDFSKYAGKTLILYNDAPAPNRNFDPRHDYYTANPDLRSTGGAPSTLAGYGPNTRTIMQIRVRAKEGVPVTVAAVGEVPAPVNAYNKDTLNRLNNDVPAAFAATQEAPIVKEGVYLGVHDESITLADGAVKQVIYKGLTDEAFDLSGRMMSMLGVEMPIATPPYQLMLPFFYIDPPTEVIKDGEVQVWKFIQNGMDVHPIHFHGFNVQLINRVRWDNTIVPPHPDEVGWKETVKMEPLTIIYVAVKAKTHTVPWELPNSVRLLDVTQPIGSAIGFTGVDMLGNPAGITNDLVNYGDEYIIHCHMLAHEENDMMRAFAVAVPPLAPTGLFGFAEGAGQVTLVWTDTSVKETGWTVQRANGGQWTTIGTVPSATGPEKGAGISYTDTTAQPGTTYSYRVIANNLVGYTGPGVWPTVSADSLPSQTVKVTAKKNEKVKGK